MASSVAQSFVSSSHPMAHASTAPAGRLSRGRMLVSALVLGAAGLLASTPAQARDTQHFLPIMPVMASTAASQRLGKDVAFFFGDKQPYERIEKRGWARVNPKTNATNKSDAAACRWVFLSALRELQEKAREYGANAVINIRSDYDNVPYSSSEKYECHAGNVVAGVALRGDLVILHPKN
ncbi:heavy metal-binding domain-containing protein [Cobetia marina]|uniref:heavy metal-binding domain-containing protein n=1 Tax=Cobetia marina TaxID=28258 RepID=UPI0020C7AD87